MIPLDQTTATPAAPSPQDTEFVQFWNEVLAPKFIRFRHILVDGPDPPQRGGLFQGCRCARATGCWMSAAASVTPRSSFARIVGTMARSVGIDCCDAFLDRGRGRSRAGRCGPISV